MHSVLFICTANQCRSPLAEGLLRLRVGIENPNWRISSAGTWAYDGAPATRFSLQVLSERGCDLNGHASRTVNKALVDSHRLILTMERGHKEALRIEFPKARERIFLLSEMIGKDFEIDDPIGHPLEDYQAAGREIDGILDQGFEKLSQLSSEIEAPA